MKTKKIEPIENRKPGKFYQKSEFILTTNQSNHRILLINCSASSTKSNICNADSKSGLDFKVLQITFQYNSGFIKFTLKRKYNRREIFRL